MGDVRKRTATKNASSRSRAPASRDGVAPKGPRRMSAAAPNVFAEPYDLGYTIEVQDLAEVEAEIAGLLGKF